MHVCEYYITLYIATCNYKDFPIVVIKNSHSCWTDKKKMEEWIEKKKKDMKCSRAVKGEGDGSDLDASDYNVSYITWR